MPSNTRIAEIHAAALDVINDAPILKSSEWFARAVIELVGRERPKVTFTDRVREWLVSRLGAESLNRRERALRIVEEAAELAQAEGLPMQNLATTIARVYSRPVGEPKQEMGGLMVCVYGWIASTGENLDDLTECEVSRIESVPKEVTRAKHDEKARAGTTVT